MGRVVKGSHSSVRRYEVNVPEITIAPARVEPDAYGDEYGFMSFVADAPLERVEAPPPPPVVDVEAIKREAQAIIDDAGASAEALLADAHERARTMIEDAAMRSDAIAEEARRSAHAAGLAAGTQAADREMAEMLASMRNLVEMSRVERHKLIESAEPELVRLAVGIAERVLHQQIALDRGVVVEMARSAIARLVDRESITVRVNPADIERMREHRDDMLANGEIKNVRIIEDQRVDRGGVVVETDNGSVDARISTQLVEVKKVLHIDDDVIVHPAMEPMRERSARAS